MSCELSVGTNGSNTKESFLSVIVLWKVFLNGNQPLNTSLLVLQVCRFSVQIWFGGSGFAGGLLFISKCRTLLTEIICPALARNPRMPLLHVIPHVPSKYLQTAFTDKYYSDTVPLSGF